ncbi:MULTISPECIES: ATP-binding protein [unclassified Variovorax]|uniref:ATP-binding protein n=1 Tax=unclassified Variovorax TaxID=663243 RepID=UPI001BD5AE6E|nr:MULTISPECIES: ATP-binding protein [unclassified Variovorax]
MTDVVTAEVPEKEVHEAELTVGPRAIDAYARLSYTMWFALGEFVDNSTQSRLNYGNLIDEVLRVEGQPLTVSIVHDRPNKTLTISDNSIGMSKMDLIAALRIAQPTPDSKGRSKYGMGMKTAACWIGAYWVVTTCELGSGEEWTATVDVDAIANRGAKVPLTMRNVSRDEHYTKISISKLRRVIQTRSEQTIKDYLGSMYMFDLRPSESGQVEMKLTYNGEEVLPPQESDWDTDPSGIVMKRDLSTFTVDGKTINGWIGVLRKGGRKYGGFSMFQNGRQIQGYPTAWKPSVIFGGVDDEGANNLITQRVTGVLLLDGFGVSHTKDKVLFEGEEEEALEKFLVEQTKDYVEYAKSRRSSGRGVAKWSRDQVRDLVKDMQSEFTSAEMKDALASATLPPPEIIMANNQQQLLNLTAEDEVGRLNILPELQVNISVKETSQYEPHVVFVPGSQAGVLHVIINGLHPYYQTLEAKDAIAECVQQYIFDAVAEFKTSKLIARVNPDSVRNLKNGLLRARAEQLANADAEVRAQATAGLFGGQTET